MDRHPGAGYFSLLILCFVIWWAPSQETPVPETTLLEKKIFELKSIAKKVYESYENLENSLQNVTEPLVSYGPELNLSAIYTNSSIFLKKLQKISELKMDFSEDFKNDIIYLGIQLENLQKSLLDTDTTSPPLDIPLLDPFKKKLFTLNTFKQFFHFVTHLFENRHHFRLSMYNLSARPPSPN